MATTREEHRQLALDVLRILRPGHLDLKGRTATLSKHLRDKVEVVSGLDNLHQNLYLNPGFSLMFATLSRLESEAYGVIFSDVELAAICKDLANQIMAHPWSEVIGLGHDIGDNIENQLVQFVAIRLAFGQSCELIELCLEVFDYGFWPFGWDENEKKLYIFSCHAD